MQNVSQRSFFGGGLFRDAASFRRGVLPGGRHSEIAIKFDTIGDRVNPVLPRVEDGRGGDVNEHSGGGGVDGHFL